MVSIGNSGVHSVNPGAGHDVVSVGGIAANGGKIAVDRVHSKFLLKSES